MRRATRRAAKELQSGRGLTPSTTLFEPLQTFDTPIGCADRAITLPFVGKPSVCMPLVAKPFMSCDENIVQEIDDFTRT